MEKTIYLGKIQSFAQGRWHTPQGEGRLVYHAVTGEPIAEISSEGLDFKGMLDYARSVGGPNLRKMTFHERARMLKALALYLSERKAEFYQLSQATGATRQDAWLDIDGGIGTFFVYASKGRRELPNERFLLDGEPETISRGGTFIGHHLLVPLEGVAVHINAFNFPCWGMLEKLAPTLLAGMPAIIKPASVTAYVAERIVRAMLDSGLLPEGALQLICGNVGDLFDHLTGQDVVTFTGSAETGLRLKSHPTVLREAVRLNLEADSLNFSMLGPDVTPEMPEFELFIQEVVREMTIKTGQRCTAIRRTLVPIEKTEAVLAALSARLRNVAVGNPASERVQMGPLVSRDQVTEVRTRLEELAAAGEILCGGWQDEFAVVEADVERGAFFPPTLLYCAHPFEHTAPHEVEAFGPVNTVMPYRDLDEAIYLAKMGRGSLVGSLVTTDAEVARTVVLGTAAYHGRLLVLNRECAQENTGHGSPLPHLVHGGPGRAGGGEELGGLRGLLRYMQRTALQGTPTMLTAICNEWMPGAAQPSSKVHPFRKYFEELAIGETLTTARRTVTEADIVNFAGISGDFFYAHMDELAARESALFQGRVAHGYFVLSAAAGLFVDPHPGPVLANYGLENLRFTKPVKPGDTIQAKLTVKKKIPREGEPPNGVVVWHVDVINQHQELVATYDILTLVALRPEKPAS
jgi:oxepin-CoA hydrolase/3-oxo-5,6-dehydrosuberyl-CoA semialdehyde dehydrogenase